MLVWDDLGGDAVIFSLVPEAYAAYRRPLAAALRRFVEGLPGPRAAAIVVEQVALGAEAGPAQRLAALAQACPVLHKLGQVLARDRRLDPALRVQLQRLESMPPQVPMAVLRAQIEGELGPLQRLGLCLEPAALAEASVAVVVPFRYPREAGTGPGGGRGVFKVLKPGIAEQLDLELTLLEAVGADLDRRCAEFRIPPLDYQQVFGQVRDRLGEEVKLDQEQRNLTRARAAYAGWEAMVQVPRLLPWSSPRVTAMERIDGRKVTDVNLNVNADVLPLPASSLSFDRRRLARRIVEALIAQPLWTSAPDALFHADPHAGNLLVTGDGRLGLLDWSLVGALGAHQREAMAQVVLGAVTLDSGLILGGLRSLAERVGDEPALERLAGKFVRQVRQGRLPGFAWLMELLDDAVQTARLRVDADLLMFRRVLLTLEGVLADVAGPQGLDLDAALLASFLHRLAGEWTSRAFVPPTSRAFGTRLSNADLLRLALSLPWMSARTGLEWWQALLAPHTEAG